MRGNDKTAMFHHLPSDKFAAKSWLATIKSGKTSTKCSKVCSKHFDNNSCYKTTANGKLIFSHKACLFAIPIKCLPLLKLENKDTKASCRLWRKRYKQIRERFTHSENVADSTVEATSTRANSRYTRGCCG